MNNKFFIWLLAIAVAISSCYKDPVIIEPDSDKPVPVNGKVYFTGSIPPIIDNALRLCMTNIVASADEADIIVVNSADIAANAELVKKAWNADKIVVEVEPSFYTHKQLWRILNAPALMVSPEKTTPLLIGVRGYSTFCLHDPLSLDEFLSNEPVEEDEKATSSKEPNEEYPGPPSIEGNAEFLAVSMDSFMDWLNENVRERQNITNDSGYSEFNGRLSDFITNSKFTQRVTMSFPVGADEYKLCKIASSKPDIISRHSNVDVTISITPLYAYEENGKDAGDYYFVNVSVISKNGDLFGTYKKKHGAIWTYAHAFYSEDIKWSANISNLKSCTVDFLKDSNPSPGPTSGSSSYTSSMTSTLNITGQGGAMGGKPSGTLTIGGSFSWSNSKTTQMSDMIIELATSGPKIVYDFMCVNFAQDDNVNKAVPLLARGDQECLSSWCWHVKGLSDKDTTAFNFDFTLEPMYGYMYRHTSWWAEGHYKHGINLLPESKRKLSFKITPPDRRPTGILDFMCTEDDSMLVNNVRVKDYAKDSLYGAALSAYEKYVHLNFQLPAEKYYYVEFDVKRGQTGSAPAKKYILDSLYIKNLTTTYAESYDGKEKQ